MSGKTLVLTVVMAIASGTPPLARDLLCQTLWSRPDSLRSFGIQVAKPLLAQEEFSGLSSVAYLSVNWPLSGYVRIVGELPISYGSWEADAYHHERGISDESSFDLGNPYLGVSLGREASFLSGQVGVRLPFGTSNGPGASIGSLTDNVSRQGEFLWNRMTLWGIMTVTLRGQGGSFFAASGGWDVWIPEGFDGEKETSFLYGARAGLERDRWTVLGGLAGRVLLTEDEWPKVNRSPVEMGLEAWYRTGDFQPNLFLRIPLDERLRETRRATVGIGLRRMF
ncbi:MAG: hypothetical protein PVJ76_10375 [Gemmatimonadota bacterium]|jgi:hypothetical protein